jgi:hypothetical protein
MVVSSLGYQTPNERRAMRPFDPAWFSSGTVRLLN